MVSRDQAKYVRPKTTLQRVYSACPESVRQGVDRFLQATGVDSYLELLFASPLRRRGWFESFNEVSVGGAGDPIPWTPYAFIDFINARLPDTANVFEYGSGSSTIWYAKRAESIVAVEDNEQWYEQVDTRLPPNAEVVFRQEDMYPKAINNFGTFELIVIDGSNRNQCATEALPRLTADGVVIWDDSYNDAWSDGYAYLRENGFREIFFQGMGPVTANLQRTSIFYRDNNCLNI